MGIILHLTNFKNRTKQKKMKCENYLFQLGLVVRGRPQPESPQFMSSDRYSRSTSLHRIRTSGWIKIDFSTIFSGITIAATSLALESFSMIRSWLKCWTQLEYICCMFVWKGKIAWNDKKKSLWEWASNNNVSSRSITDVVWPLKKNCEMKMSFCCSSLSLRDVATIKLCLNYIYVATSHIPLVVLRHLQTVIINHFRHQPHSRSVYVPAFGSIKYSKRRIHKSNTMKEFALRQTEWATNKHTNTISAERTVKMKVENDYDNFKVGQKKKEAKFWRNKGKENRN